MFTIFTVFFITISFYCIYNCPLDRLYRAFVFTGVGFFAPIFGLIFFSPIDFNLINNIILITGLVGTPVLLFSTFVSNKRKIARWLDVSIQRNFLTPEKKVQILSHSYKEAYIFLNTYIFKNPLAYFMDPNKFFDTLEKQGNKKEGKSPTEKLPKEDEFISHIEIVECLSCGAKNHRTIGEKNFCMYCNSPI